MNLSRPVTSSMGVISNLLLLLLLFPPSLSVPYLRPTGFSFPSSSILQQTPWPPWPSYPPRPPPWLQRPTRAFRPYFGPPPPETVAVAQPSYCDPDPVTGNLPFDCIDIIDVRIPTNFACAIFLRKISLFTI